VPRLTGTLIRLHLYRHLLDISKFCQDLGIDLMPVVDVTSKVAFDNLHDLYAQFEEFLRAFPGAKYVFLYEYFFSEICRRICFYLLHFCVTALSVLALDCRASSQRRRRMAQCLLTMCGHLCRSTIIRPCRCVHFRCTTASTLRVSPLPRNPSISLWPSTVSRFVDPSTYPTAFTMWLFVISGSESCTTFTWCDDCRQIVISACPASSLPAWGMWF
jgi:hypothetical protein